jgi:hypothetical protein
MTPLDPGEEPVKIIYLVQRKPGTNRDTFVRRWRQHGALGMSMARWRNVKRYAHCDIRGEVTSDGRFVNSAFDGIGMSQFRSMAHRADHAADTLAQQAMVADEREAFAELVAKSRLLVVERPAIARCEVVAAKAVRLIEWGTEMDDEAMLETWEAYSRQSVSGNDEVSRHVLDMIFDNAGPDSPLRCQAVDELGFCSGDALKRFAAANDLTSLTDGDGKQLGTARVFATTEVVLYDKDYAKPL